MSKTNETQGLISLTSDIKKKYGESAIFKIGDAPLSGIHTLDSGSIALNIALGGGYAYGRIIEIYGAESSGKTTLALHAIANIQKEGGEALFIDAEHALDLNYAKSLGVNVEELSVVQPDHGEMALDIVEMAANRKAVDIIVVDSVAALIPKAELEADMGDSKMGLHARLMSQAMRKLTGIISKANCIVIFINQIREKIGVVYGSPEVTTGGNALKFYASQRLRVSRTGQEKEGDIVIGNATRVKVEKNKIAPPHAIANFSITFGIGINRLSELVDIGSEFNIINKSGSWYSYGDVKLGQGKNNVMKLLEDNIELQEEIESKIKEAINV